jgi:hypothetical protein
LSSLHIRAKKGRRKVGRKEGRKEGREEEGKKKAKKGLSLHNLVSFFSISGFDDSSKKLNQPS